MKDFLLKIAAGAMADHACRSQQDRQSDGADEPETV